MQTRRLPALRVASEENVSPRLCCVPRSSDLFSARFCLLFGKVPSLSSPRNTCSVSAPNLSSFLFLIRARWYPCLHPFDAFFHVKFSLKDSILFKSIQIIGVVQLCHLVGHLVFANCLHPCNKQSDQVTASTLLPKVATVLTSGFTYLVLSFI